ncbi:MAG: T9SS type A sorting domain-containing protein [Candidatus Krumholzibacteriota bacterium]|nr:T9SS type A sorting domain-containing protein [Candidatus Krumholzibacteriota bacterium]
MRSLSKFFSFSCIFLAVVSVQPLWACWVENGLPVCTETSEQTGQKMISDGAGGAIVAWVDYRGGIADIYAQRMNGSGYLLWAVDGVGVCLEEEEQYDLQLVSDGDEGAIIVWRDNRNGFDPEIYAQRVDSDGNVSWTGGGVAICSIADGQNFPKIVPDGAGGAIVTWESNRGVDYDIYAQRVSPYGYVGWTIDGIAVCSAKYDQMRPAIVADGSDGFIIAWRDDRGGNDDIFAQRVNTSGELQWATDGIPLCTAPYNQSAVNILYDGDDGAIVAWEDLRGGDSDIYSQRVDSKGDIQWASDGIPLCSFSGDQQFSEMVSDGAGGAIVEWHDGRNGHYDIYAQRVDHSGNVLWTVDGVPVYASIFSKYTMKMASDGAGGAIIAWSDSRSGNNDVYVQRVDSTGSVRWDPEGICLCESEAYQSWPQIVRGGNGGAIVVWRDLRAENYDLYGQFITDDGNMTYYPMISAVKDVPGDQGGKLGIYWNAVCDDVYPETEITYYSLWRRLSDPLLAAGQDASLLEMPDVSPDFDGSALRVMESGYYWEWLASIPARYFDSYAYTAESLYDSIASDPGWQYFMVTAHTPLQYLFYDSPIDSGYSVDNLSPSVPGGLSAEQSYSPEGISLTWDDNGEPDFHHYNLYRGSGEDFVPSPENLIASPPAASWFDGEWSWDSGYWYKLAAVDVHGNESALALAGPDNVTGDEPMPGPVANFLAQNFPNPFNPCTVIKFGVKEERQVSLRIYDTAGRLIVTLVDKSMPAGNYSIDWNGRDENGTVVVSGVYFYRLAAGDFQETRKMVLLR